MPKWRTTCKKNFCTRNFIKFILNKRCKFCHLVELETLLLFSLCHFNNFLLKKKNFSKAIGTNNVAVFKVHPKI